MARISTSTLMNFLSTAEPSQYSTGAGSPVPNARLLSLVHFFTPEGFSEHGLEGPLCTLTTTEGGGGKTGCKGSALCGDDTASALWHGNNPLSPPPGGSRGGGQRRKELLMMTVADRGAAEVLTVTRPGGVGGWWPVRPPGTHPL
ncbi:hypothetical protein DPEC_G00161300 [Dallia pectoralis]|uniref:Uncharacterized protein n=1 Tax=Dallia pectoralis TaxID=75939 RepID=A0ACC2GGK9_DALPE|nr:hypothetical protein DPEC_G00161300 [Dallia pectoralis]